MSTSEILTVTFRKDSNYVGPRWVMIMYLIFTTQRICATQNMAHTKHELNHIAYALLATLNKCIINYVLTIPGAPYKFTDFYHIKYFEISTIILHHSCCTVHITRRVYYLIQSRYKLRQIIVSLTISLIYEYILTYR